MRAQRQPSMSCLKYVPLHKLIFIVRHTKWIYDGFIEFHNSVIGGFLSKMRSSAFSSDKIREASQPSKLFQMCLTFGNTLLHSTAIGSTATAINNGVRNVVLALRRSIPEAVQHLKFVLATKRPRLLAIGTNQRIKRSGNEWLNIYGINSITTIVYRQVI